MKKIIAGTAGFLSTALFSIVAFAQEGAAPAAAAGGANNAYYAMSAAFAIGIAAAFGAISQAKAAAAALEGTGRNPGAAGKVQTPMIIALALIESLVIYALVIAFLIQGKIV